MRLQLKTTFGQVRSSRRTPHKQEEEEFSMSWPCVGRECSDWLTKLRRCTLSDITCGQLAAALKGTAAGPGRSAAGSQINIDRSILLCLFWPSDGVTEGHFLSAPDVWQLLAFRFCGGRGGGGGSGGGVTADWSAASPVEGT